MRRLAPWTLAAVALALATPAATQTPPRAADLERGRWAIQSYFDGRTDGAYQSAFNGVVPTFGRPGHLTFQAGRLSGTPGCGVIEGNYALAGERLSVQAGWREGETDCPADQRNRALQIVKLLNGGVIVEPVYRSNLRLSREKATYPLTQAPAIELVLEEPGKDLSEYADSWWRITRLEGTAPSPGAVVQLRAGTIRVGAEGCGGTLVAEFEDGAWRLGEMRVAGETCPVRPRPPGAVADRTRERAPTVTLARFDAALRAMSHYVGTDASISARDRTGRERVALARIEPDGVENRLWRVHSYDVRGNLSRAGANLHASVAFFDGELEGSLGCGTLSGGYERRGEAMAIRARGTQTLGCPAYHRQEQSFIAEALNEVARARPQGERYLLLDQRGRVKVVLAQMHDSFGLVQRVDSSIVRRSATPSSRVRPDGLPPLLPAGPSLRAFQPRG